MIMNIKQRKIQIEPKTKLNYNIYEATVTKTSGNTNTYIGMTENDFKTRYNNHKLSFNDRKHSHDTVLSRYIWELRDNDTNHDIKWRIIKRANAYKGTLHTATYAFLRTSFWEPLLLNKRFELVTKCRHENKFFATNHRMRCPNRP